MDLSTYLKRIEYQGDITPDYATLEALHLAHATHIPFENVDILLGKPVSLDLESLQGKLVDRRRGGYCFEHNTLFAAVLREVGFSVTPLAARVRHRQTGVLPRTHMCLQVGVDGNDWLADVGFGGEGLLLPVPMSAQPVRQFLWTYRLIEESTGIWVLQSRREGYWNDLYAFSLEAQEHVDFEMANYYVSTHPQSSFVRALTVQLPSPEKRQILRGSDLTIETVNGGETRRIERADDLLEILKTNFGVQLPTSIRVESLVAKQPTAAAKSTWNMECNNARSVENVNGRHTEPGEVP